MEAAKSKHGAARSKSPVFGPVAWAGVALLVGGGLVSLAFDDGLQRYLQSYLLGFSFVLSISLGALFFVLVTHLTRAGWSVTLRRMAENIAASLWIIPVLFLPIVLGLSQLYVWASPDAVAHDPLLQHKAVYLNAPFFVFRWVFYFGVWIFLASYLYRLSGEQDRTGDPELTLKMERLSAPGMMAYSLTVTFASFDLLMSLDAHWFSTIFGVYFFSGSVVSFFALLALVVIGLQQFGHVQESITIEHLHDVGKLTFAFLVFWAYIAFSQYMLIWYGNLPEETGWYIRRQEGDWMWVSFALVVGHFIVPFLFLMSKHIKRRKAFLATGCAWVLLMHALDLYYLIMPQTQFGASGHVPFHVYDVVCLVGFVLLMGAATQAVASRRALIPVRDPRLAEALAFEIQG